MKQFYETDDNFRDMLWGTRHAFQPLFTTYHDIGLSCWDYIPREFERYNWGDVYND